MSDEATVGRVEAALEGIEVGFEEARDGMTCVAVARERVHQVLERLRDRAGFETNTLVTAVDHLPAEPRFEVVWQLLSVEHADRVRVRVRVGQEEASVPTCTDLWPGASFSERECFDMFGIRFEGHPDLRRLLMPEDYEHYPLRRDFPHQGIEPRKLYDRWDRERRKAFEE